MSARFCIRGRGFIGVRRTAVVSALALAAALAPSDARAEYQIDVRDASASASFQWRASPFGDLERRGAQHDDLTSPEFSAFAAVENGFPEYGRAAAYQDLYGINAVFAESGLALDDAFIFNAMAETNYVVEVTAPTEATGQARFTFVINGGELRIDNFARLQRDIVTLEGAGVGAEIFILGVGTWRFTPLLTKDRTTGAPVVRQDAPLAGSLPSGPVDDFGVGFPPTTVVMDAGDAVVTIPRFEGEVLIDRRDFFGIGVLFNYRMTSALNFEDLSVGGLAGIGDPFSLAAGGPSTNGVEFFLDGLPLSSYPLVPEPGSTAVLILGAVLLGAGLSRSRRRRD